MQDKKNIEILKCPKCKNQGIYFRENKDLHYKCKKCGNKFNLEV